MGCAKARPCDSRSCRCRGMPHHRLPLCDGGTPRPIHRVRSRQGCPARSASIPTPPERIPTPPASIPSRSKSCTSDGDCSGFAHRSPAAGHRDQLQALRSGPSRFRDPIRQLRPHRHRLRPHRRGGRPPAAGLSDPSHCRGPGPPRHQVRRRDAAEVRPAWAATTCPCGERSRGDAGHRLLMNLHLLQSPLQPETPVTDAARRVGRSANYGAK